MFHSKRLRNALELFPIILHLASRATVVKAWLEEVKGTGGKEKSKGRTRVGEASSSKALIRPMSVTAENLMGT